MGVKRSLRCKKCEHNLLKPEFSPNSIKFKIHLCASNQIPDVRILTLPDWNNTEESVSRLILDHQKNVELGTRVETIKSLKKKVSCWLSQILHIRM